MQISKEVNHQMVGLLIDYTWKSIFQKNNILAKKLINLIKQNFYKIFKISLLSKSN